MRHNVEQFGYNHVQIVGDAGNDIVDVCRLTCLEQGIKIVDSAGSELLPTHHSMNPTNSTNSMNSCPVLQIDGHELFLQWPKEGRD